MTAKIKGTVVTPDQKSVRVTEPAAPGGGTVIIAGDIAVDQTSPLDVDVLPGTYRLTVYAPTRMLTARTIILKDGDTLDLASILEGAPDPAGQAPGVALIDGDGKLLACANIQVVHSREEADALPDGTVYVLAASAPAPVTPVTPDHGGTPQPPAPAGVQLVDHAAGQAIGDTITVMLNGQAGDRAVVAINTKAVSDQSFTWPPDWTVLVDPYWVGTQQFTVASGPWAQTIDVKTAKPVEAGWAGFAVRGGGAPTVGTVKDRTKDPKGDRHGHRASGRRRCGSGAGVRFRAVGGVATRAKARGYRTMCMMYPNEVAGADLTAWDVLGMEWNAPDDVWATLRATGKPLIAHIITTQAQATRARERGATGLMSSVPSQVHP